MKRFIQKSLLFPFLFFILSLDAQTVLEPGDIAVLGVVTDQGLCGNGAESDEISFVCFKDITSFTEIHLTDNGWEAVFPDFWGDSEGTLRLFRVGLTIPRGTVITIRGLYNNGMWNYEAISPDNGWIITNINNPGGPFNLEVGGDQFYFLQGGTWDNQGGGMNQAIYDGKVIYGFNTLGAWSANGTSQQSNLHPEVIPCFNMVASGSENYKYINPLTPANQLEWWHRIQDPASWTPYADCNSYGAGFPFYINGYSIPIQDANIGTSCLNCSGCAPFDAWVRFNLPPGYFFDVAYTDGTDTFYITNVMNSSGVSVVITDTTTFSFISVTEVGGCPISPDLFNLEATYNVPSNNPGTHNSFYICPDYGVINLHPFLGPHDLGGTWSPALVANTWYHSSWGPGTYVYTIKNSMCPDDTASVTVHHIDTAGTTIDIICNDNGTPANIFDDRMEITLNFVVDTQLGPDIEVRPLYLGAPWGSATPNMGILGVPFTFLLAPGSATKNNLFLEVQGVTPWFACDWLIPLPPPGYCSDPCDHAMAAYISADGTEMCPNQCPDEPITFEIEIAGGEQDYTMEFSVTATGYPTWTFSDIPVDFNNIIEVCISDVPTPIFDEFSGMLTLPAFLNGHDVIITFLNVYDYYGCTAIIDNAQHVITIHTLPPINTTSLSFCKSAALSVDLTEYDHLISTFFDITWYDDDPYAGGSEIFNTSSANLELIVQLWAYVENDYCGRSIQVPFTILSEPKLNAVPPLQICDGGAVNLPSIGLIDIANTMAIYTFHLGLPPDTSNQIDTAFFLPVDTTTIYVLATAGMCHDTLAIEIDVQDYPGFSLEGQPCDAIFDTYSILFTSSADSIHANFGTLMNNPVGQDTITGIPNDSSVTIEILNPSGLCKDTFLILAPNCNCPVITQPVTSQPSYNICEGLPIPVLTVNVGVGMQANWYDVPSGGIPLLQNSLTYQPASAISAIYYAESFDPAIGCYSIRTDVPFEVHPIADLQMLPDQQLCEPSSLDFNSIIPGVLNGVAGSGQWFDLNTHQVVTGSVQPQDGDGWYYHFTTNAGACISSDTIIAAVNPSPSIDFYNINCDDIDLTYDLAFITDADLLLASIGSINQITGTDSFLLTNIPYDTDVQFDLQITSSGCNANFTQLAPDCSCPALLDATDHQACTDQGNVDLSVFEGPGVNGTWQLVSTPAGSNPATLAGNNFQGVDADEGLYTLRFIRNVILTDCIDTALFNLQLSESPFADAGNDATVCAPDQIILSGIAGGSNVLFNWQTNGNGTIINPNSLITSYTPTLADITTGSVNFSFTANDQTGFCPSASESIAIDIDGTGYFILDPGTITYCDTANITVDLDALVSFGTTGGEWFFPDTVSAPIIGSSQINPATLQPGSYTVFYTTNAIAPCQDDTIGVNLIIENCACPSVALSNPATALCSEASTQDLNDFLITSEPGTWTMVDVPSGSKPGVIAGTAFITDDSDAGIYRLRFSLSNPIAGCPDFAEITIEVISIPTVEIKSVECSDDLQSWETIIISTGELVSTNLGTLTSLGNNEYLIGNITLNTNVLITASNNAGLCVNSITVINPDCACTINISNLPVSLSICPGDKIFLQPTVNGAKGSTTSFWIIANDSLFQSSLEIDNAGIYNFVSVDSLGCTDEQSVDVNIYQQMVPDISMIDITCPGDMDGSIVLHAIQGGNGPFFISFNGGINQLISSFPYNIDGLSAGNHQIDLLDAFSCMISFNIPIQSASSESIQLGPDQTILTGDSLLISPVLSFVPDSFYWMGDITTIDPTKLDNWIQPDTDQFFELFGIDDKGCLYKDDITIKVLLNSQIYVPTIFSPNDDGINDFLAPLPDPSVITIEYFEIFSRWGELVYAATSFAPNSNPGWDGTSHDKPAMPGVYVYRLSATNKKGKVITQVGDITLIR